MKKTITELEEYTKEFFEKYWKEEFGENPQWSKEWIFEGEVPNRTDKGCYSLFQNEEVAYIGVAIGSGKKDENGLGQRISNYWKKNEKGDRQYTPTDINKEWLTSIRTIGFPEKPEDHSHLAAALEVFLIKKMSPKMNKIHTVK